MSKSISKFDWLDNIDKEFADEIDPEFGDDDGDNNFGGDERDDNTNGSGSSKHKSRGRGKIYNKEDEFPSFQLADEYIKREGCWARGPRNRTDDGLKSYYRCNKAPKKRRDKRGRECSAGMYILSHSKREAFTVYRTEADHDHDERPPTTGLPEHLRSLVNELIAGGMIKARLIGAELRQNGHEFVQRQLTNYVYYHLKQKAIDDPAAGPTLNVGDFEQWCERHSAVPPIDQPDKTYVIAYGTGINDEGTGTIKVFFTTPRLLQFAARSDRMHVESSEGRNWENLPVVILGTSNQDRNFFPFGLALTSDDDKPTDFAFIFQSLVDGLERASGGANECRPDVLIADSNEAIADGFKMVFGEQFTRITCWEYVRSEIEKRLKNISDEDDRGAIFEDILQLQHAETRSIFDVITPLFFTKWTNTGSSEIDSFLQYFRSEWIDKNKNWFDGYAADLPSSNACMPKRFPTNRDGCLWSRLRIPAFLDKVANELLSMWSRERDESSPECKFKFVDDQPSKTASLWSAAYQFAMESKNLISRPSTNGFTEYFVPGDSQKSLTPPMVSSYQRSFAALRFHSFDEYVASRNRLWVVTINPRDWESSARCNCPSFMKEFICKHTLGVALRNGLCEMPRVENSVAIGSRKRKRNK